MSGFEGMDFGGLGDGFGFDLARLQELLSWREGPVNWPLAKETAFNIAGEPRPILGDTSAQAAWNDAVLTADTWLAPHTNLPSVSGPAKALSPHEWIDLATGPMGIARYVEPVAHGMHEALTRGLAQEGGLGISLGDMGSHVTPITAMATGIQVGQIAGRLATQLVGAWDLSMPTMAVDTVAIIGGVATEIAQTNGLDPREVEFVVALRECAHRRLYTGVPWLLDHLTSELHAYGNAAQFNIEALMAGFGDISAMNPELFNDPEAMRRMSEQAGAVHDQRSPEQEAVQERLQTLVTLINGYTDVLIRRAGTGRLPNLDVILDVFAERANEPGAGERIMVNLLGLDLHPEDLSQGSAFCDAVERARGAAGLDRVWSDAEHLPSRGEVMNPRRWLLRVAGEDAAMGTEAELPEVDFEVPEDLSGLDNL
ncbi:zinc-dependent metalloprotease [Stomatohabitans albus]|uniref:zinc-dependent metalloprotease n=1 Tax=Stomatohabitans albus TaxID=3110766 RepID=UPI00300CDCC4